MMNPTYFRLAQIAFSGLTFVFALAVIGTAGHTLDVWNKQHDSNLFWAPLWTGYFDVNGTKSLLGAAVTVVILHSIFLALSFLPSLNLATRPTLRAVVTLATILPAAFVTLATVLLAHVLNHNAPDSATIQTWTCQFSTSSTDDDFISDLPADQSNASFARLCTESRFALYASLIIFLLQAMQIGLTIVSWVADQWAKRKQGANKEGWATDGSSVELGAQGHAPAQVNYPHSSGPIPQGPPGYGQ